MAKLNTEASKIPAAEKKSFYEGVNKLLTKAGEGKINSVGVKGEVALTKAGEAVEQLYKDGKKIPKAVITFYNTYLSEKAEKSSDEKKTAKKTSEKNSAKKDTKKDTKKTSKKTAKKTSEKNSAKKDTKKTSKKTAKRKKGVVRKTVEAYFKNPDISIADMTKKMDKSCPRDNGGSNKSVVSSVMCVLKHVSEVTGK